MKTKKFAAFVTALLLSASFPGVVSGYGEDLNIVNNDMEMSLYRTMINWTDDSEHSMGIEGRILSDRKIIAVPGSLDDYTVKLLGRIQSSSTEYMIVPDECVIIYYDAFENCSSMKGLYIPDSVMNIQKLDEGFTVVGNRNSYAEFFAEKNGNEFIISGDIDNNGKVGAADLVAEMQFITGQTEPDSDADRLVADTSHDGNINVLDLIHMKNSILNGGSAGNTNITPLAAPDLNVARSNGTSDRKSGYIDFAADFTDNILLDTEDEKSGSNRVYSPVSVYMAVSVLAECCEDKSLDELLDFLDVSDKEELRKTNRELFESLYFNGFEKYCRIGNSLWINNNYTCEEETLNKLAENYYTSSFARNLASREECGEITKWIYQNTSGKFSPEIIPSPDSVLKIINTVTFREKWDCIFDRTVQDIFHGSNGDISCDFMESTEHASISETEKYVKFTKKFNDDYRMNFILPSETTTVNELLSDKETMGQMFNDVSGSIYSVSARIPKFSSESKFDLIDTLKNSGVSRIFTQAEIWSLMDPSKNILEYPYVDEITHEAVIDVNEEGCEASAYTMISVTEECAPLPYSFTADRPFIYYISDTRGTPVFIGTVNNPTEK